MQVKNYRNFRYVSNKPIGEVIEDFARLSVSIRNRLENKAKIIDTLMAIFSILIIISIFLCFVGIGFLLLPLFIICSLYFSKQSQKYHALQNYIYRYSLSKKIVSLLNRDIKENSRLNVSVDFNLPIIKRKRIKKTKSSNYAGRKITNYFDPWLNIQGEFADRTKFKFNIAEYYRNTSRWKTSRSGKRKWKSKNKFKGMEIELQLIYQPKKYGGAAILKKDAIDAIVLAQTAKLKAFKISPKLMQIKVFLPQKSPALIYQTVISMFLSLYQILNLARTLSKVSK